MFAYRLAQAPATTRFPGLPVRPRCEALQFVSCFPSWCRIELSSRLLLGCLKHSPVGQDLKTSQRLRSESWLVSGRVGRLWAVRSGARRHDLRLVRRSTVSGFRKSSSGWAGRGVLTKMYAPWSRVNESGMGLSESPGYLLGPTGWKIGKSVRSQSSGLASGIELIRIAKGDGIAEADDEVSVSEPGHQDAVRPVAAWRSRSSGRQ